MEQILAGLGNRIFLLNNVHEDAPEVFETRWAMSYLRGPLTRTQIKSLMEPIKAQANTTVSSATAAAPMAPAAPAGTPAATAAPAASTVNQRPVLPPEVAQYFIPARSEAPAGATLTYHPMVLGAAEIHYSKAKSVDLSQELTLLANIDEGPIAIDWDHATAVDLPVQDLEGAPVDAAGFSNLPAAAGKPKNYDSWRKDFAGWIYRNQKSRVVREPFSRLDLESRRI